MEGQDDDFDERVEPIAVILTAFVPRYLWKSCPHSFRMSRQFDEFQCKIGWSRVEIFFVRRPKGPIFTAQASGGAAKAHRRRSDRRECGPRGVRTGRYRAHV